MAPLTHRPIEHIVAASAADTDVLWSIAVRHGTHGAVIAESGATVRLATASIGKVLLLIEVARRFEAEPALRHKMLDRRDASQVNESGLWQFLECPALPMADVAVLTASLSDNWATNTLLDEVGLDAVDDLRVSLGITQTRLLDRVRSARTTSDEPHLSAGSASELSLLMARLWSGEVVSPGVSHTVTSWLRLNADLSMVAADWGLDPLAHVGSATLSLFNKTGSDAGVRADIGTLVGPAGSVSYAVIANWPADRPERAPAVYAAMRTIGAAIRDLIDPPESPR